jgi:hypothetical protein
VALDGSSAAVGIGLLSRPCQDREGVRSVPSTILSHTTEFVVRGGSCFVSVYANYAVRFAAADVLEVGSGVAAVCIFLLIWGWLGTCLVVN